MVSEIQKEGIKPLRRVSAVYLLIGLGVGIAMVALVIGLVLSAISADYYANSKAARDAADVGSRALTQLGQVQAIQAWLLPFKFVGVAALFAGIGLALSAIIKRIQMRGQVMAEGLRELLKSE